MRGLAVGLQAHQNAVAHDRPLLRLDAVIVVADRRRAAGMRAIGGDVHQLRAVFQLAEILERDEARAGVVGFVADDAIELGRVRDDLVDGQRRMRRHQHQILQPAADRLGHRVLDRLGRHALGVSRQVACR